MFSGLVQCLDLSFGFHELPFRRTIKQQPFNLQATASAALPPTSPKLDDSMTLDFGGSGGSRPVAAFANEMLPLKELLLDPSWLLFH